MSAEAIATSGLCNPGVRKRGYTQTQRSDSKRGRFAFAGGSMRILSLLVAAAVARVVPGRFGYWLDLGLILFALYLCGCAVGSWLRDWVVSRSAPTA